MGTTSWKEDTSLRSPELVAAVDKGLGALGAVRAVADRPVAEVKQAIVAGITDVTAAKQANTALVRRERLELTEDSALGIKYGSAWIKPMKEIGNVLSTNTKVLMKQLKLVNKEMRAATKGIKAKVSLWLEQYREKRDLSAGAVA